ncbi:MAG: 30S ribosomal protein S8 [Candidatus Bipolaricaulaceae bacterium]
MTVSDPIADMLTRLRNAGERRHEEVTVPSSRLREEVVRILAQQGYVEGYTVDEGEGHPVLRVRLKYVQRGPRIRQPAIRGLRKISRPARRVYVGADEVPNAHAGLGICILSTSQGILTGREARARHVGGELLCEVW